jgi:predicted Zn-dependent peptidase
LNLPHQRALVAPTGIPTLELPSERFTLGCGARLLVSRRAGAPVTAIEIHLRGGPAFDPPDLEGCAFLTAALLDQGTKRHSEEELAELLVAGTRRRARTRRLDAPLE